MPDCWSKTTVASAQHRCCCCFRCFQSLENTIWKIRSIWRLYGHRLTSDDCLPRQAPGQSGAGTGNRNEYLFSQETTEKNSTEKNSTEEELHIKWAQDFNAILWNIMKIDEHFVSKYGHWR